MTYPYPTLSINVMSRASSLLLSDIASQKSVEFIADFYFLITTFFIEQRYSFIVCMEADYHDKWYAVDSYLLSRYIGKLQLEMYMLSRHLRKDRIVLGKIWM